ncbi:MAG: type IV secretion system protein [Fusobacterium mortiferum]|nr:type IV secretion system protein [Fusobacterium mortiferum]
MKSFKPPKAFFNLTLGGHKLKNEKDKYYELSVNANNWRKMCLSLLIIVVFLAGGLLKIALTKKVDTFIVEKNGNVYSVLGEVNGLSKKQEKASEQEIIYFLNEVIDGIKGLPRNTEIYEKNYRKSLAYLSRNSSKKIDSYLKDEGYVDKVKNGKTVEISFNTGTRISDNTYQIRWRQTTYTKEGEIESSINYSAIITITFTEVSEKTLYINPLGLLIVDFSQKEEML